MVALRSRHFDRHGEQRLPAARPLPGLSLRRADNPGFDALALIERVGAADLEHLMRLSLLGRTAASLMHELAQPVTAIVAYADACLDVLRRLPDIEPRVESAISSISSQARLAAGVMARTRPFARQQPPQKRSVAIQGIIRKALEATAFEFRRCGVAPKVICGAMRPRVVVDPVQLQQVLINLIRNALEAMSDRPALRRRLRIRARVNSRGELVVAVSDTGRGLGSLRPATMARAFQSTRADGMGLGLAISRSILAEHGGRLEARSNRSGGATFSFVLPTRRGRGDRARSRSSTDGFALRDARWKVRRS